MELVKAIQNNQDAIDLQPSFSNPTIYPIFLKNRDFAIKKFTNFTVKLINPSAIPLFTTSTPTALLLPINKL